MRKKLPDFISGGVKMVPSIGEKGNKVMKVAKGNGVEMEIE